MYSQLAICGSRRDFGPEQARITRLPAVALLPMANREDVMAEALDCRCACAMLRRAARSVTQFYDLVLSPCGLKATEFVSLKIIHDAGEIAQCDFAREHTIARVPKLRYQHHANVLISHHAAFACRKLPQQKETPVEIPIRAALRC
jgi:hypothetical protein